MLPIFPSRWVWEMCCTINNDHPVLGLFFSFCTFLFFYFYFLAFLQNWTANGNRRIKKGDKLYDVNKEQVDWFCKSLVSTLVLLSNTSSVFALQMDLDRTGSGLPKCLHLSCRCYYIGLLQIKWLSKMLIKTSNNLHFVYSNLHNCTVTQSSALQLGSDFHQLSSNFDVLTLINTVEAMCAMQRSSLEAIVLLWTHFHSLFS